MTTFFLLPIVKCSAILNLLLLYVACTKSKTNALFMALYLILFLLPIESNGRNSNKKHKKRRKKPCTFIVLLFVFFSLYYVPFLLRRQSLL